MPAAHMTPPSITSSIVLANISGTTALDSLQASHAQKPPGIHLSQPSARSQPACSSDHHAAYFCRAPQNAPSFAFACNHHRTLSTVTCFLMQSSHDFCLCTQEGKFILEKANILKVGPGA
jgi:hypothetical protein